MRDRGRRDGGGRVPARGCKTGFNPLKFLIHPGINVVSCVETKTQAGEGAVEGPALVDGVESVTISFIDSASKIQDSILRVRSWCGWSR